MDNMGEHGTVAGRSDVKIVVVDCPNGMSYIGHSAYGAGARKGEGATTKINNYIVARTDGLLSEVLGSQRSFETVAKAEYQSKASSVNPGTFAPGSYVIGVHNLDEHL
jgi:hypothetical protein